MSFNPLGDLEDRCANFLQSYEAKSPDEIKDTFAVVKRAANVVADTLSEITESSKSEAELKMHVMHLTSLPDSADRSELIETIDKTLRAVRSITAKDRSSPPAMLSSFSSVSPSPELEVMTFKELPPARYATLDDEPVNTRILGRSLPKFGVNQSSELLIMNNSATSIAQLKAADPSTVFFARLVIRAKIHQLQNELNIQQALQ